LFVQKSHFQRFIKSIDFSWAFESALLSPELVKMMSEAVKFDGAGAL